MFQNVKTISQRWFAVVALAVGWLGGTMSGQAALTYTYSPPTAWYNVTDPHWHDTAFGPVTLSVNQFNPDWGTLTSVSYTWTIELKTTGDNFTIRPGASSGIWIENTTTGSLSINVTLGSTLTLHLPTGLGSDIILSPTSTEPSGPLAGGSSMFLTDLNANASSVQNPNLDLWSIFTGHGTVDFNATVNASASINDPGGNFNFDQHTVGRTSLSVEYVYAVPEASSLWGMGFLGLLMSVPVVQRLRRPAVGKP